MFGERRKEMRRRRIAIGLQDSKRLIEIFNGLIF